MQSVRTSAPIVARRVSPLNDTAMTGETLWQADLGLPNSSTPVIDGNVSVALFVAAGHDFKGILIQAFLGHFHLVAVGWTQFVFEKSPMIGREFRPNRDHLSLVIDSRDLKSTRIFAVGKLIVTRTGPIVPTNATFASIHVPLNLIQTYAYRDQSWFPSPRKWPPLTHSER